MNTRDARKLKTGDRVEYSERTGAIVHGEVRGVWRDGLRVEWFETDHTGMAYFSGTILSYMRKA